MSMNTGAVAAAERYFEDFQPGSTCESGSVQMTEAGIIAFARQFDPQYFHIDPQAAVDGPFGGLIASGWHTGSTAMRLYVDSFLAGAVSLGSPGMDEVHFIRPVRPGDSLRIRVTVLETRRSRSKPQRGFVTSRIEVLNQKDEIALSMKVTSIFACRNANLET
jgi:acyl dehydratase